MTTLRLRKSYRHRWLEGQLTIQGMIRLPEDEVERFKQEMSRGAVSTIDPRIEWEDEEAVEGGWEYEDWSFEIIGEECGQPLSDTEPTPHNRRA